MFASRIKYKSRRWEESSICARDLDAVQVHVSSSFVFRYQILETSSSLKVCNRVAAVLRRIILGLLVNGGMMVKDILLLCHGLISESLPLLTKRDRYPPTLTTTHIFSCH